MNRNFSPFLMSSHSSIFLGMRTRSWLPSLLMVAVLEISCLSPIVSVSSVSSGIFDNYFVCF